MTSFNVLVSYTQNNYHPWENPSLKKAKIDLDLFPTTHVKTLFDNSLHNATPNTEGPILN